MRIVDQKKILTDPDCQRTEIQEDCGKSEIAVVLLMENEVGQR